MELYTGKFIQGVLNQMPKQNNHEKYLTIFPFAKYHNIILNFEVIQFSENYCCITTLPLNNVFGTIVIDDVLYILLNNQVLHILYKDGKHNVLLLDAMPGKITKIKMKLNKLLRIWSH